MPSELETVAYKAGCLAIFYVIVLTILDSSLKARRPSYVVYRQLYHHYSAYGMTGYIEA